MFNFLQKLRMISARKIIAVLCAGALAAPVANPAAAYDQICFRQIGSYTTNGVYLRKVRATDAEAIVRTHHMTPSIIARKRKCMDVRGKMNPGDPFNIVQDIKSGADKRCHIPHEESHGTLRWPAGGGTLELHGAGIAIRGFCFIVNPRMWAGCADDALGGFSQLGCAHWRPEARELSAHDIVLQGRSPAELRAVLEEGADPNIARARRGGETPLHAAVRLWRRDYIDILLDGGANPLLKDGKGNSAFLLLLEHGRGDDVLYVFQRMLHARVPLSGGRNARMINEGLATGGVPAMINVVRSGNPDLVELALNRGGDARAATYSRYSALHHAAKVSLRMVRLLLAKGADPNMSTRDGFGTPLHWAVNPRFAGQPLADGSRGDMAAALLNAGGDPNATNRHGQTPLHFAAQIGDVRAVGGMLNRNGDPNLADGKGLTALHYAAVGGHSRIMEHLIRRGADPSLEDNDGNTAAELASR